MDKPETVKIGTRTYTIKFKERLEGGYVGWCYLPTSHPKSRGRILVKSGQTDFQTADTLIHEILHGIWEGKSLGLEAKTEERVVTKLATGLARFFKDNPEFTDRLLSLLK